MVESGTMFGEAALLPEHEGAYAEILELSRVGFLNTRLLRRIVHGNLEVGLRVAELLASRARLYADRMADIALKRVPARLASLFLWLAEIEGTASAKGFVVPCRYTQEQLGAIVGAKRVPVTRAMKKLRDTGALEADKEHILIKDREALEGIATGFALAR